MSFGLLQPATGDFVKNRTITRWHGQSVLRTTTQVNEIVRNSTPATSKPLN